MNDAQQPPQKRRWIPIVLGILALGFFVIVGGCVVAFQVLRQQMSVTDMSASSAADEFQKVRAKFAGQKPLIQVVDGRPQYMGDRATDRPSSSARLQSMHLIVWDEDEENLVRMSVPMWLVRMKSGPIRLSSYANGWDDGGVSFRVEDLEKHGPGLLMDTVGSRGDQVLIWVE